MDFWLEKGTSRDLVKNTIFFLLWHIFEILLTLINVLTTFWTRWLRSSLKNLIDHWLFASINEVMFAFEKSSKQESWNSFSTGALLGAYDEMATWVLFRGLPRGLQTRQDRLHAWSVSQMDSKTSKMTFEFFGFLNTLRLLLKLLSHVEAKQFNLRDQENGLQLPSRIKVCILKALNSSIAWHSEFQGLKPPAGLLPYISGASYPVTVTRFSAHFQLDGFTFLGDSSKFSLLRVIFDWFVYFDYFDWFSSFCFTRYGSWSPTDIGDRLWGEVWLIENMYNIYKHIFLHVYL